ncbi:MAG: hypothetical protein K6T85_17410, partial [Gorillibacterium sp.]|nr:hypothetical protein [Gorillibacterium sp.]
MKQIILKKILLTDQMKLGFVQNIMGKYGISRWRDRFHKLILRQYSLLFAEPVVAKNSTQVGTKTNPINHMHVYKSFYNLTAQTIAPPPSGGTILKINQSSTIQATHSSIIKMTHHSTIQGAPSSITNVTYSSSRDSAYQKNMRSFVQKHSSEKGIEDHQLKVNTPFLSEEMQETIREHRVTASPTTYSFLPIHSDRKEPEVVKQQVTGHLEPAVLKPSILHNKPTLLGGKQGTGQDQSRSNGIRQQQSLRFRSEGSLQSRSIQAQIHTLQRYEWYKDIQSFPIERPSPLLRVQEVLYAEGQQDDLRQAALVIRKEAAKDTAKPALEAKPSQASLSSDPSSKQAKSLKLALGKGIETALESIETLYGQSESIRSKPTALKIALKPFSGRTLNLIIPIPTEQQDIRQLQADSTRQQDSARLQEVIMVQGSTNLLNASRLISSNKQQLKSDDHFHSITQPLSSI